MLSSLVSGRNECGRRIPSAAVAACPTLAASICASSAALATSKKPTVKASASALNAAGAGRSTSSPAGDSGRPKREPKPLDPNNSLKVQLLFNKERRVWRKQVGTLVRTWRVERRQQQSAAAGTPTSLEAALAAPTGILSPADALQQRRAATAAVELDALTNTVEALAREKRRADVDHEMACFRLQRAEAAEVRRRAELDRAQRRRNKLLDASRLWITRETLVDRINQALDDPQPFGFITTHRVQKGSAYRPGAARPARQEGARDGEPAEEDDAGETGRLGRGSSQRRASWWVV